MGRVGKKRTRLTGGGTFGRSQKDRKGAMSATEHKYKRHKRGNEDPDAPRHGKGGKGDNGDGDDDDDDTDSSDQVDPVPAIPAPKLGTASRTGRHVIVVLEKASLELVKKGADYQLLNCDDHGHIMRKHGRDPASARPDITHQALLALLDSPLNKNGLLSIMIRTEKDVLIEVSPQTRIPRTFRRFAGLMVQLLHKLTVRAADTNDRLLRVIKNPVEAHLPAGAHCYGTSCKGRLVRLRDWVKDLPADRPVVLTFGAMSHGFIDPPYCEELVSFSKYPLSAACAIGKFLNALEDHLDIV